MASPKKQENGNEEEEDDDFERCNEEIIQLEDDNMFSFGKNEESKSSASKGRSNRYEQTEEADPNEIDLVANETLESELTAQKDDVLLSEQKIEEDQIVVVEDRVEDQQET